MCAIYKKNKKLYGKNLCKEYKNYLLKIIKRKKYDLAWKMISIINKCLKEEYQRKLQLIFFCNTEKPIKNCHYISSPLPLVDCVKFIRKIPLTVSLESAAGRQTDRQAITEI